MLSTLALSLAIFASQVACRCHNVSITDNFEHFDSSIWSLELGTHKDLHYGHDGLTMTVPHRPNELETLVLSTKQKFLPPVYFDIEMLASPAPGIVTPAIFRSSANISDEIDLEVVGASPKSLQTVLWRLGERLAYSTRDGPWEPTKKFYKYRLGWFDDKITLSVNGQLIRTHPRRGAQKKWPVQPLNVKLGPWASDSGKDWAGVLDWQKYPKPQQKVKSISIVGCAA